MNEIDKHKLNIALKVIALFAYGLITIGVCSSVWRAAMGPFRSILAVVILFANGYVIYRKAIKMDKES